MSLFICHRATEGIRLLSGENVVNVTAYSAGENIAPFKIMLVDYYDATVAIDYTTIVTISVNTLANNQCYQGSTGSISGGTNIQLVAGESVFTSLQAVCVPGGTVHALITATSIQPYPIEFHFRTCISGEVLNQEKCKKCEAGTYVFDFAETSACLLCPGECTFLF